MDPVHEIQETLNQQKECLRNMHTAFNERLQHLEDELSVYFRSLESQKEIVSENDKPLMTRQLNLRHETSAASVYI